MDKTQRIWKRNKIQKKNPEFVEPVKLGMVGQITKVIGVIVKKLRKSTIAEIPLVIYILNNSNKRVMDKIRRLRYSYIMDDCGNHCGTQPPTNKEMIDKINELVEVVNHLQQDIRKKYKVIRRYDVLLLAKQKLKEGEYLSICSAINFSLTHYKISREGSHCFPLHTRDQALRFGASKINGFWWKPGKFGILSGRRRYLNWLLRKYKNDTEILNTIEIYG